MPMQKGAFNYYSSSHLETPYDIPMDGCFTNSKTINVENPYDIPYFTTNKANTTNIM